jgi:hypothetical protein
LVEINVDLSSSLDIKDTGIASTDFDVSIVANSHSWPKVVTNVKIEPSSTWDVGQVKLWNNASPIDDTNEWLQTSGEYLWTEEYTLTDIEASFKVEFKVAGTYEYTINLLLANNNKISVATSTGKIIINPYQAPSSWGGGGGGWVTLKRDDCPSWDFSPDYYDWTCWDATSTWTIETENTSLENVSVEELLSTSAGLISYIWIDGQMLSDLKQAIQNGNKNSFEIIKIWDQVAIKLNVFNILDAQWIIVETLIDSFYSWKLNKNNLQKAIYARNKLVLLLKKVIAYPVEERQIFLTEIRNVFAEFYTALKIK